jgi:hypothetical protein
MPGAYERRIGRRVDVEPVAVLWRADPERKKGARFRKGPHVESGALIDLSVSGLKVRAPMAHDLSVGAVVPIEIDGVAGRITIRRITPVDGTRFADYGAQIMPSSHDLADWARARLDEGAAIGEDDWRAALDNSTS